MKKVYDYIIKQANDSGNVPGRKQDYMKRMSELTVGKWIQNSAGIFEVTEIDENSNKAYAKEVCFKEEDADEYTLGQEHTVLPGDLPSYIEF